MSMDPMPPDHVADQARPGAMTMAMQATRTQPQGPKVLRIGVLDKGKIVEERIIRTRESVTVGASEENHFVVHAPSIPISFELFEIVDGDYVLNFTGDMTGRVGLASGVQELEQLRSTGAARRVGEHWQIELDDDSRGKVVMGHVSLLFQFVEAPPVQPRPQLPAAAKAGFVRGIDWPLTAHVTFAFLAMFALMVYMEHADWPIDDGLAAVPERLARLIFEEPPPPQVPEAEIEEEGEIEEVDETSEPTGKERKGPSTPAPGPRGEAQGPAVAEQSARIAAQAAQAAEALILGALSSEGGGALADVLAGGAATGSAEDVLAAAAGIGVADGTAGGTLRERSGGGSGSGQGQDLGALARAQGGGQTASEGKAVQERAIRGRINLQSGGDIGGAGDFDSSMVVRTIKARLRAIQTCYERELKRNPSLAGKVTVEFTIQERGNVTGAKAVENTTGDRAVAQCVVDAVTRFRFNPGPVGGSVTFAYPFVFAPQH